jgi:hypothetical protein
MEVKPARSPSLKAYPRPDGRHVAAGLAVGTRGVTTARLATVGDVLGLHNEANTGPAAWTIQAATWLSPRGRHHERVVASAIYALAGRDREAQPRSTSTPVRAARGRPRFRPAALGRLWTHGGRRRCLVPVRTTERPNPSSSHPDVEVDQGSSEVLVDMPAEFYASRRSAWVTVTTHAPTRLQASKGASVRVRHLGRSETWKIRRVRTGLTTPS